MEETENNKSKLKGYIDKKNITKKKIIKAATIVCGLGLIVFMTVSNAIIDPEHLDFFNWLSNSLIIIAIMVFGLLMGESLGEDEQKDKINGLYQTSINEYKAIEKLVKNYLIYFSQFFIWFKEKELKIEKVDFLMDNEIDGRWAKQCVDFLEKSDFEVGKFIIDESNPNEKIYLKKLSNGKEIKIHKATKEEAKIIIKMFEVKIETYGYSYYLTYTKTEIKGGKLKKAVPLNKKINRDKLFNRTLKIISALFISLIWGMLTTREFTSGEQKKQAWFLLLSRVLALFTSIVSGWTSAVISVKDQAQIIKNKADILQEFYDSMENKIFIPETYDQMIEREYNEQISQNLESQT